MPESVIKFGFSGGVFSPRLSFRSDLEKFDLGLAEGRNFTIDYTGGVSTRAGFEFLDYIQDDDEPARIVEFAFNKNIANTYAVLFAKDRIRFLQDGAYVLEPDLVVGGTSTTTVTLNAHGYANGDWVKFLGETCEVTAATTNTFQLLTPFGAAKTLSISFGGQSIARIYTLASPYATADLPNLTFSQYRDELYIASTDYALQKLSRITATNWTLTTVGITANNEPPIDLILTPSSAGTAGVVFAVTAVDQNGRESFINQTGMKLHALSVNYTTTAGSMRLQWSPPLSGAPVQYYKIYRSLVLSVGAQVHFGMDLGYLGKSFSPEFTDNNIIPDFSQPPPMTDLPIVGGQIFNVTITNGGTGYNNSTTVLSTTTGGADFSAKPIVSAAGVVTGVRILNPGYNYFAQPTIVSITGAGTGCLAEADPTPITGYNPACTAMIQQRRVRVGLEGAPGSIFGSRTGFPDNFSSSGLGTANDPYGLSLDTEQLTPIRYVLAAPDGMFLFQDTGITQIRGVDDRGIAPNAVRAIPQTVEGCARIPPLRIDRDYIFVHDTFTSVNVLRPSNLPTYYTTSDLTTFSEHFFRTTNPIVSWTWAKAPHRLVWGARQDGSMLSMTYNSEQNIAAWSYHTTRGRFEDAEAILEENIDRVYVIAARTVSGVTKRYIERSAIRNEESVDHMWAVDCGLRTALDYPAASIILKQQNAGVGASLFTAPAGQLYIHASSPVFSPSDIGKVFRLKQLRGEIIQHDSSTVLLMRVDRGLDYEYEDPTELSDYSWAANEWSLTQRVTSVSGLDHLEGLTVQILGDGQVLLERVVTNGSVTLSIPSSFVVVGLGYTAKLRTLPMSIGNAVVESKRKRIAGLAVRIYNTLNTLFGDAVGDQMFSIPDRIEDGTPVAPVYKQGLYEMSLATAFTLDGDFLIEKSGPVHTTLLGYVAEVELEN